jgi:hypothetical protein
VAKLVGWRRVNLQAIEKTLIFAKNGGHPCRTVIAFAERGSQRSFVEAEQRRKSAWFWTVFVD